MSKRQRIFIVSSPATYRVNRDLAEEIGFEEALILLQIEYWISISVDRKDHWHEGKVWIYKSVRDMANNAFPWWGKDKINNAIKNLLDQGYLVEGNFNKKHYDRTRWFALGPNLKHLSSIKVEED